MKETSSSENVSTKLQRIAELARMPGLVLTTLAHHIDIAFLKEAYRRTRKDGAAGVDGQTASEYAANLDANLTSLLTRFKTGSYQAPPVKRVHIPKGDGRTTRPIGIPTFEDKVLQRAVAMVLEAVYEQEFHECSYGFRPGRSAHNALSALWKATMEVRGGWVVEVDIKSFFDTVQHGHLRAILDQRVCDGVIRRMIDKWLNAGVLEDGGLKYPSEGTPQGGVLSPLLANIYLHEVLDDWFWSEVFPALTGRVSLIRYADDFVVVCSRRDDATRVLGWLSQRFAQYGLTLHPDKTRIVDFRKSATGDRVGPTHFDFLGFRHYWGDSRWKTSKVVKRKTAPSRFTRALKRAAEWMRRNRHRPVAEQHRVLEQKLRGHYAYYGITGNSVGINRFRHEVWNRWQKWLSRRSDSGRRSSKLRRILQRFPLGPARVIPRYI